MFKQNGYQSNSFQIKLCIVFDVSLFALAQLFLPQFNDGSLLNVFNEFSKNFQLKTFDFNI